MDLPRGYDIYGAPGESVLDQTRRTADAEGVTPRRRSTARSCSADSRQSSRPGLCSAAMDVRTLLRRPSAFLPLALSLAALGLVVWFVASFGVVRGVHDEGAAARIFQVLMVAQLPIVGYFALT